MFLMQRDVVIRLFSSLQKYSSKRVLPWDDESIKTPYAISLLCTVLSSTYSNTPLWLSIRISTYSYHLYSPNEIEVIPNWYFILFSCCKNNQIKYWTLSFSCCKNNKIVFKLIFDTDLINPYIIVTPTTNLVTNSKETLVWKSFC